ncbi:MAG: Fe-S protein assembly co-chaperone HscB [Pseudomonadales bacterium]|nr:Fe-S protein assembly co-chaperone HscB [Pseudomonadales bacterium]
MLNYFHLFNLPESFFVDEQAVRQAYQRLQAQHHPDRHIGYSPEEQHRALAMASDVNEGWRVLRSPVLRAGHLLALRGMDQGEVSLSPEFLMQQIAWREQLESSGQLRQLEALRAQLRHEMDHEARQFEQELARVDAPKARSAHAHLQFFHRLLQEIEQRVDHMDEES